MSKRFQLTGASVIIYQDGKVLLQQRKDNLCWAYHGGRVEMGEQVEAAAKRELYEETGLVANSLRLYGVFSGEDHYHVYPDGNEVEIIDIVYVCTNFSGGAKGQESEVNDLQWFALDRIPENLSPPIKSTLLKFVREQQLNASKRALYSNAPEGYICPFCLVVKGIENEHVLTKQSDIIYQDEFITAFISAGSYPNNKGHVLIIPNEHYENIYQMPLDLLNKVHAFEQRAAVALKQVYHCDGVSSRQHNEYWGNQDVWHYHLHVFPRYKGDNLYKVDRIRTEPEERLVYAQKLRAYFQTH